MRVRMTGPVRAYAPGRVNLIGDHTDHAGGLVLPMAVDLGTTVTGTPGGDAVVLRSSWAAETCTLPLDLGDPASMEPSWCRYVAGVIAELRPDTGFTGEVDTTLPVGAGLSSSAALEVSAALALGFQGSPSELARLAQRAEQRASGVPCGIMDQLSSASGVAGAVLLIDCHDLHTEVVHLPPDLEVVVVDSGQRRALAASAYGERRRACEEAAAMIGPLRAATLADVAAIPDAVLRRRARHVVTESARVAAAVEALRAGDAAALGGLMKDSHASLRDDFDVSTPALDELVQRLETIPGVHGARLTGAGFGGCVVAASEPGALQVGRVVRAAPGARRQAGGGHAAWFANTQ